MDLKGLAVKIKTGEANRFFIAKDANEEIIKLPVERIESLLEGFTKAPMIRKDTASKQLSNVYRIFCWIEAFEKLSLSSDSTLLEIAPGNGTSIVTAFDAVSSGKGKYTAVNLNKKLTEEFKTHTHTKNPKIDIRVIEDDVRNLLKYVMKGTIDIVAANHAIDNILETIIAEKEGIDTVNSDYLEIIPKLIRRYEKVYLNGTLKNLASKEFIDTIKAIHSLLKPGGYLIFHQFVLQEAIDFGASVSTQSAFVDIAREWIRDSNLDFETIKLDDFDPKWWVFFKKC